MEATGYNVQMHHGLVGCRSSIRSKANIAIIGINLAGILGDAGCRGKYLVGGEEWGPLSKG